MSQFTQQVGRRIQALRISQGILQETLAQRSAITRTHLSRIENGRCDMALTTLEAISNGLKVEPWQLLAFPGKVQTYNSRTL
jgi:transcriptional regulator with XRE-family HTH domain